MPLLVRNTEPNATVFSKGSIFAKWGPAGDPMGEDIQRVPDEIAEDVDFLRSVDRGILVIEDGTNKEVLETIQRQAAVFQTRRANAEAAETQALDRRQDRDIVQVPCIGPGKTGGQCDTPVLIRAAQRGEVPPLCKGHESLSSQYYLAESGSAGDTQGGVRREWKQIQMTAPQRSSQ